MPLKINDLRNAPISVATLPKLDVLGSSPIARSLKVVLVNELQAADHER
jgi:hypothetical protein